MKRVLIIGLLAILTLVAVPLCISSSTDNTAYAQELEIGEVIENRTQTSKTYYLGNNSYSMDVKVGSVHYKNNPRDITEPWKEINNQFIKRAILYIMSLGAGSPLYRD